METDSTWSKRGVTGSRSNAGYFWRCPGNPTLPAPAGARPRPGVSLSWVATNSGPCSGVSSSRPTGARRPEPRWTRPSQSPSVTGPNSTWSTRSIPGLMILRPRAPSPRSGSAGIATPNGWSTQRPQRDFGPPRRSRSDAPLVSFEYVDDHDIDLVVLEKSGQGKLSRRLLGSVIDCVVAHAGVPCSLSRP